MESHDAITKALRTLLLLATHESLGVSELSRKLNVAPSTAHRLLGILRSQDFAEQDPVTRRYRLGPAAVGLGSVGASGLGILPVARIHLEWLNSQVGETVNLIMLHGPDALFIDGIESRETVRVATRNGAHIPAYATAGGKALLAQFSDSRVRSLYSAGLDRITGHTVPDVEALCRDLLQVRANGYALNIGEHQNEVNAVGVAVYGRFGSPIAAVTIAAPNSRWDRDRLAALAPTLREAAKRISEDLRGQSRPLPDCDHK